MSGNKRLEREMEQTLRRYEEELWSAKTSQSETIKPPEKQTLNEGREANSNAENSPASTSVWTKKAIERAAVNASMPKSPVASRQDSEVIKRYYMASRRQQGMHIGWVLGARSRTTSATNDGEPGASSSSMNATKAPDRKSVV